MLGLGFVVVMLFLIFWVLWAIHDDLVAIRQVVSDLGQAVRQRPSEDALSATAIMARMRGR